MCGTASHIVLLTSRRLVFRFSEQRSSTEIGRPECGSTCGMHTHTHTHTHTHLSLIHI